MALPKVDVCIVGLGAGGGVMAKELAAAGMKVVGLELGPLRRTTDFREHDELRYPVRRDLLQPRLNDTPMTLRPNAGAQATPAQPWTSSVGVGGGTVHYAASSWRMLPHHFRMRSDITARYGASALPPGTSIVDWPITYDDLEPYYAKADAEIGLSGQPGNLKRQIQTGGNPFEGPRSAGYPTPPIPAGTAARMIDSAASELGYKPFPTPAAIISRDYDGRPGCNHCGFCSGYGCHIGAKSSILVSVIPKAVASGNFEIRANSRAIRINKSGDRATSVTYLDSSGAEQEQPAGLIILASYTFEIVRLLLHSGVNNNGMVGKYLMGQHPQVVNAIFETEVTNPSAGPAAASRAIDEFNGDNFDHAGLGFIEGAAISGGGGNMQAIGGVGTVSPGTPEWGVLYKDYVKKYFRRTTSLVARMPSLPYEANFLDLDPSTKDGLGLPVIRATYDGYDNEKRAGAFLQDKMDEILKKMGATRTWRGPLTAPPFNSREAGGCRMGNDPAASVVNRYGQSHELGNLFIAGGAVFPTHSGYEPTLTIQALSYWSANYIKNEAGSGGSLAGYL